MTFLPLSDGAGIQYKIPPEALSDEKFMNMLREAEKYLGMEYVWAAKAPEAVLTAPVSSAG